MSDKGDQLTGEDATPWEVLTDKQKLAFFILLTVLPLAILIFYLIGRSLDDAAQISTVVGGVGTLFLSLLGAVAGLWWFFRRQSLVPRINIEQDVTVLSGPRGMHLLQVFARLENKGDLPVSIKSWRIWVCPLDPLPTSVGDVLLAKSACVDKELPWESCSGRRIEESCFDEIRIRAGEIQETIASVIVQPDIKTVKVYSFFPHPDLNENGEDRGWTRYSIVRLEGEQGEQRARTAAGARGLDRKN